MRYSGQARPWTATVESDSRPRLAFTKFNVQCNFSNSGRLAALQEVRPRLRRVPPRRFQRFFPLQSVGSRITCPASENWRARAGSSRAQRDEMPGLLLLLKIRMLERGGVRDTFRSANNKNVVGQDGTADRERERERERLPRERICGAKTKIKTQLQVVLGQRPRRRHLRSGVPRAKRRSLFFSSFILIFFFFFFFFFLCGFCLVFFGLSWKEMLTKFSLMLEVALRHCLVDYIKKKLSPQPIKARSPAPCDSLDTHWTPRLRDSLWRFGWVFRS